MPCGYAEFYTPVWYKQFGICVIVVAWKLAQSTSLPLSSIAEELAARAIVEETKGLLPDGSTGNHLSVTAEALHSFLCRYVNERRVRCLFTPPDEGSERVEEIDHAPAFEDWVRPFSRSGKQVVHPYVFEGGEQVGTAGQAYTSCLSRWERAMLQAGTVVLLDEVFEDCMQFEDREPDALAMNRLVWHLPRRYLPRYSWQFFKQFVVCLIMVGWKLAQKRPKVLSSVAEELATNAIIEAAQEETEGEHERLVTMSLVDDLQETLLEDLDFTFLFDDQYDGIDQTPVGQMPHMAPMSFEEWFNPFSDDPERMAHPYVARE